MIIHIHITYSPTYPSMETDDMHHALLTMAVTIYTVDGSCYSAHQAVSKFAVHHIDMVRCVHRKCQTRAAESGDIYKSFDCVTI